MTAVVSGVPDLVKIQGEIADTLGLEFERKTVMGRASQLSDRLKMKNRILIILDDVWEILDVSVIGIPLGFEHVCNVIVGWVGGGGGGCNQQSFV